MDTDSPPPLFIYNGQSSEEIPRDVTHVVVHESVETIEAHSFEYCLSLQSLKVPGTIKTVGQMAFNQCILLMQVNLHEGLTEIGIQAFTGCLALKSVTIPSTVVTIGRSAFMLCVSLQEVKLSKNSLLATIHNSVFSGCQSLTKIYLPPTVKTIGERAFRECLALNEVDISDGLVSIQGNQAFAYCTSLRYIRVPKTVTSIYFYAFERCNSLVSIEFPHDALLKTIGDGTFRDCTALENANIPKSLKRIGESAFEGCTALHNVRLQEGLVSIGSRAFAGTKLETLAVPGTVELIEHDAFNSCRSLTHITLSPRGLTEIAAGTFSDCDSLVNFSVPQTVALIGERAFAGCSSLIDIKLNEGLEGIKMVAFAQCAALSTVALPLSLKRLGMIAFLECTQLMTVEIPAESKVMIGLRCFERCTALVNVSCTSNSMAAAFNACSLLARTNVDTLVDRYVDLPVHDICYHSSVASVEDLNQAIRSSSNNNTEDQVDAFGLTPFHVLGASVNPRVEMLESLLNYCDAQVLKCKDKFGNAVLDYLLRNTSIEALSLVQMILEKTIVKIVSATGVDRWISEISRLVDDVVSETKPQSVHDSIYYFGYCMRIEVTSLIELAAWKRRMCVIMQEAADPDDVQEVDRSTCRLQSGSDVVLENVVKYLWSDESFKVAIGLSVFPICTPSAAIGEAWRVQF